jgi:hypothetical protein
MLKVKSNKGIWRAYDAIAFENKDCVKEHERLKQLESSNFEISP